MAATYKLEHEFVAECTPYQYKDIDYVDVPILLAPSPTHFGQYGKPSGSFHESGHYKDINIIMFNVR